MNSNNCFSWVKMIVYEKIDKSSCENEWKRLTASVQRVVRWVTMCDCKWSIWLTFLFFRREERTTKHFKENFKNRGGSWWETIELERKQAPKKNINCKKQESRQFLQSSCFFSFFFFFAFSFIFQELRFQGSRFVAAVIFLQ